jgi:hypothetical protein
VRARSNVISEGDERRGFVCRSLDPAHHVGHCERVQVRPHVVTDFRPDRKQDALAFMVASSARMRFTEVTDNDGPIDGGDDLAEG